MAITFHVDNVKPEGDVHPVVALDESLQERMGEGLCFSRGPANVVPMGSTHPLVGAVHLAFSQHQPLVISPDAIWMTIAQGFSAHIRAHPEELRERFVKHEGKKTLRIESLERELDAEAWTDWIPQFTSMIRDHVGAGLHRLLLNDFSTTGDVERIASEIGMMDTFSPYFDYEVMFICGIPTITLSGTVEDWKTIRRRLDVIAEFGLADWIARLAPVADQWVKSAEGHPDRDFWQCMYMPEEAYGTKLVTGWLVRLFPYLESEHKPVRNESLYNPPPEPNSRDFPNPSGRRMRTNSIAAPANVRHLWQHEGISLGSFGCGLSTAPVVLTHVDRRPPRYFDLLGGLIGITQDPLTLAVEPKPGWCVRHDRFGGLIKELTAVARPVVQNPQIDAGFGIESIPHVYLRLLDKLADSRSLFDGAWTLRTRQQLLSLLGTETEQAQQERVWYAVAPFIDLPDGRWLGWCQGRRRNDWCVVIGRGNTRPSVDTPVIAIDLIELFERALQEGPLFFDAKSFEAQTALRDFI